MALSFNQNDYVSGSIVVTGGASDAINFYITDPKGNNVVSYDDVTQKSFSFTASTTGNYTAYFDNREGLFAKSVTFSYSDKAAALGLPQDTFILLLTIIIVIIAVVIAVVIAVLLLLRQRRKETPKAP
jgi:ABC-type phosphate/phosphonate transport system permease subunit